MMPYTPRRKASSSRGRLKTTALLLGIAALVATLSAVAITFAKGPVCSPSIKAARTTSTLATTPLANDAQTQFSGLGARAPRPVAGPVSLPGAALTPSPMTRPIRAAFYYPWFPQTWGNLDDPFTQYHPTAGYYSSDDTVLIAKHVAGMRYGHLDAAISSWWGQGQQRENTRFPAQLAASNGTGFTWTLYYEKEGFGDPSSSELSDDLSYIKSRYAGNVNYLKINGRPVIFVYGGAEACSMVDRWKAANTFGFYVVLKVFGGYGSCANQPDNWHQYGPAAAVDIQTGRSFVISPGFHLKGESIARLAREPNRFAQNVADMVASNAPLQLVTTFNEWGEGTAVESATEWASSSGYGVYLDILHNGLPAPSAPAAMTSSAKAGVTGSQSKAADSMPRSVPASGVGTVSADSSPGNVTTPVAAPAPMGTC